MPQTLSEKWTLSLERNYQRVCLSSSITNYTKDDYEKSQNQLPSSLYSLVYILPQS